MTLFRQWGFDPQARNPIAHIYVKTGHGWTLRCGGRRAKRPMRATSSMSRCNICERMVLIPGGSVQGTSAGLADTGDGVAIDSEKREEW